MKIYSILTFYLFIAHNRLSSNPQTGLSFIDDPNDLPNVDISLEPEALVRDGVATAQEIRHCLDLKSNQQKGGFAMPLTPPDSSPDESSSNGSTNVNGSNHNDSLLIDELKDLVATTDWFDSNSVDELALVQ